VEKSEFRILVADDDVMVRDVILKFLSEQGYSVITANDGHEALRYLRLEDIYLVLTDLRMPGADGLEILRTALQINPKIAVVILTAYGTLDTALEAVREGAYDYITKPFVMQQLLLIVRNAFKVAMILRENERLSSHLKELYKNHESVKTSEASENNMIKQDSAGRIEKLKELNIINSDEAHILRERLKPGDENIRKYSSLVKDLKKSIK
jgi:two-component system response regulator PilR (NtrC family)